MANLETYVPARGTENWDTNLRSLAQDAQNQINAKSPADHTHAGGAGGDTTIIARGNSAGRPATGSEILYINDELGVVEHLDGTGAVMSILLGMSLAENKVYNGNFDHWQRGTTLNGISNLDHTADGWRSGASSGDTINVLCGTHTPGQIYVPGNPKFFYRYTVATSGASTIVPLEQHIPGVATFQGGEFTVGYWIKSSMPLDIQAIAIQVFGSGGSSNVTVGTGSAMTMTTSSQLYTHTFTAPSISGKTIGSGDYLRIYLQCANPSHLTGNIDISQAQARAGSAVATYDTQERNLELLRCRRFYQTACLGVNGLCWDSSSIMFSVRFTPPMWGTPSVELLDNSITIGHGAAQSQTSSGSTIVSTSLTSDGGWIRVNGFSGLTAGNPALISQNTPVFEFTAGP